MNNDSTLPAKTPRNKLGHLINTIGVRFVPSSYFTSKVPIRTLSPSEVVSADKHQAKLIIK